MIKHKQNNINTNITQRAQKIYLQGLNFDRSLIKGINDKLSNSASHIWTSKHITKLILLIQLIKFRTT